MYVVTRKNRKKDYSWHGATPVALAGSSGHSCPQRLHTESLVVTRCRIFFRPHCGHFGISNVSSVMKKETSYLITYMFVLVVFSDCVCWFWLDSCETGTCCGHQNQI